MKPMTTIEAKFALLWGCEQINGPALVRQHKFHPDRKWLFDFANPESRVAIELEGGTWAGYQRGGARRGGWHQNPKVYAANCEKYRAAELMGWHVFRFTTEQVTFDEVKPVAEFARRHLEVLTALSPAIRLLGSYAGHAPGHAGGAGITP